MILEQNYIKIVEYTHKAFKIFCRRALANSIIKSLKKSNNREKQNTQQESDQISALMNNYNRKLTSEQNMLLSSAGLREQSLDQDSVKSQDKRTQNNMERHESAFKNLEVQDKLQILYGDLVYIQYTNCSNQNLRAKYFLNKMKFCYPDEIGIGSSSDLRCIFQIVYPGSSLEQQKKGTLLTESCLVSFRTISKKQYLKVKNSKIVYSDEFGKELELSKQFSENCVFQLKYEESLSNEENIISGEDICFKLFGEMLYMNILEDEQQAFFSQTPTFFTLKKLKKRPQNLVPTYYKMKSNKFQATISGNPIQLQSISQKKTMVNVIAINQKNIQNKINPFNFIQFDFNKIPEQDPKINAIKDSSFNMLNCWQFIEIADRSVPNLYQLYNPVIGLGLAIKSSKNLIKLTPNRKDFAVLKLTHHDEDIVSFCYEANLQELDIIYDGQNAHKFIMVLSKPETQNQSKKIKIKHISTKTAYMICQLTEVLDVLKSAYDFLDAWGNEVDEKLETMYYTVKQIKLGSSTLLKKVRQMKMVIKILKNYLQNPQNYTLQIQNTIHQMKILQMIIHICKVITNKIGNIYPSLQNDQQSPFCFAKINLQEILKSLFSVLLKLTKDNISNSNVVISEVDFFNQILINYPEQIGEILQESIKNLSVFTTKNNNQSGSNELFLWVKLIQPVREQTIRIQKTYIDIIAEVVVDPTDKGIAIYQNRCKQLLFIQNSKRKCIPKFGVNQKQSKPIIIFESQLMMSQFLQKNHHLSKLNLVNQNSASYFIEDFYCDRYTPQADISEQYIGYIGSIIKMFRNLCRNRNKKLFKIVDDWGINQEHIHLILNSKKIAWSLKANYLSLWSAIFIDQDPFLPFEKRESKCHYWPKISKYSLRDCTALIFKQYTDQTLAISKLNQFTLKIYPILSSYFFYLKKKIPAAYVDPTQLKSFLLVLNTVYEIINLGYMTMKTMKDCIGIILHLLVSMDEVVMNKKNNQQELQHYYFRIMEKFINILKLYEDIWVEIYGIEFLITFYKQSQTKNYCLQWQIMQKKWQNILTSTLTQQSPTPRSNPFRKRTRHNVFSQNQNTLLTKSSIQYFIIQVPLSFEEVDNQIYDYVINLMVKRLLEVKCQNYQRLIQLLDCRKRRRERVCGYLREMMIFNDQDQEQIYRNFSGRESNKLLNWLKIQQIVLKINQIQTNNNKDELEQRTKKQKILQLNNIVVKIIREMTIYKDENTNMFIKCQMVLQKLNVHIILLDILKYHEKPVYKDVIKSILDFIREFIHGNDANCRGLVPHLDKLMKNIGYPSLVDILPTIIQISNKPQLISKTTNDLIFKITHNTTTTYLITIISKLLALEPLSQYSQQLNNNLSRRILQLYQPCFRNPVILDDVEVKDCQVIFRSWQFVGLLCRLAAVCGEMENKVKCCYPKCKILENIKKTNNYLSKKIYLKVLTQIYIQHKQLQNFQIEDYLQMLVIPQMKKLPAITIKLIQKRNISTEKQLQIHNIYEQLLSYTNMKVQTKDEENYYNFILDLGQPSQVSLLTFAKLIMSKWKNKQQSDRLQLIRAYLRKLQLFLYLIFYQDSSVYHRSIFQQLQQLNILLQTYQTPLSTNMHCRKQKQLQSFQKQQIIEFYNSVAKIIIDEKISINQIFTCFNIDSTKLEMKRLNFNIYQYVSEEIFVGCLMKLGKYVMRGEIFKKLMGSVKVFRFVNLSKDVTNKQIDVYYFMDKLINLLQYTKNSKIKQQITQTTNPQDQQIQLSSSTIDYLNTPNENPQINQQQFVFQVQNFCKVSQKYQDTISHMLESKINAGVAGLSKKIINQWVLHSGFNVFTICQNYRCELLYVLLLAVLRVYGDGEFYSKSVSQFFKIMEIRLNQKIDNNILIILQELLPKLSTSKQFIEKFQKFWEKTSVKLIGELVSSKDSKNLQIIQSYKSLITLALNTNTIQPAYRTKLKIKVGETIKRIVVRGINLNCQYDYKLMSTLFNMWSDNQCYKVGNVSLFQDSQFSQWVSKSLGRKTLRQITGSNSINVNKCSFILLMTKIILKYSENVQIPKFIRNSTQQIQQSANMLYEEYVVPKAQAYFNQEYCLGYNECSQFFCNYSKLCLIDENIINLILNLFIMVRLSVGSSVRNIQSDAHNKLKTISIRGVPDKEYKNNQLGNMLGFIKYNMYNKEVNYNFKLPACRLFNNAEITKSLQYQIESIPPDQLYKYLHALSKVFHCELSIRGIVHKYIPCLQLVYAHHSLLKLIMMVLTAVVFFLQYNSELIPQSLHDNSLLSHPMNKIACIFCLIVSVLFLFQEITVFVSKCRHFYPQIIQPTNKLKYNKILKHNPKQKKKEDKQTNIIGGSLPHIKKYQAQIQIDEINEQSSKKIPAKQKNQQKNQLNIIPMSWRSILGELIKSIILLRFIIIVTYVLTMVYEQFFLFAVIMQALDIRSSRDFLSVLTRVIGKLSFIVAAIIIYCLFAFIFFCTLKLNENVPFNQIQRTFLIKMYEAAYLGLVSEDLPYQMAALFRLQQIIVFFCLLMTSFYGAHAIFCLKKEQKIRRNKCKICLKNREEIEAKGQSYEAHLTHEHRFENYLYFFIQYDTKKRLDGLEQQVQDQIKKGQYKFIKLH